MFCKTDRQTRKEAERQRDGRISKPTGKQTDRQTDRKKDRRWGRNTQMERSTNKVSSPCNNPVVVFGGTRLLCVAQFWWWIHRRGKERKWNRWHQDWIIPVKTRCKLTPVQKRKKMEPLAPGLDNCCTHCKLTPACRHIEWMIKRTLAWRL